jgi:hypothetical protein
VWGCLRGCCIYLGSLSRFGVDPRSVKIMGMGAVGSILFTIAVFYDSLISVKSVAAWMRVRLERRNYINALQIRRGLHSIFAGDPLLSQEVP